MREISINSERVKNANSRGTSETSYVPKEVLSEKRQHEILTLTLTSHAFNCQDTIHLCNDARSDGDDEVVPTNE